MQAQAKVTRIVGYGAPAIRDALQKGIISGEMKRHCEVVLQENEELKKALKGKNAKIRSMQQDLDRLQEDAKEMRTVRMTVYRRMFEGKYGLHKEPRESGEVPQLIAGFALGAVIVAAIALIVMA